MGQAVSSPRDAIKVQRKADKAQRKLNKAQRKLAPADENAGRKPCDLCARPVDLLVRCTVDASKKWRMVCGKCWHDVSGGVPDGDMDHPLYKYGGLWKNRR